MRDRSIDLLRGIVILLMALDHVRGFTAPFGPEDLDQTTFLFFMTRWITHFCAPVFVFLAGTAAAMHAKKHSIGETRRFLVTRGLWLMLLEVTWITGSWYFSFDQIQLGVIWSIGGAMLLLAGLSWLPRWAVGGLGLLATLILAAPFERSGFLLATGAYEVLGRPVYSVYVIGPWAAVMAMGWGALDLLTVKRKWLVPVGLGATLAWLVIRGLNTPYGDPTMWAPHARGAWMTAASFMAASKYPPSLLYLLMTLGPALALLPLLSRWKGRLSDLVETFGRVPLFFYLLHLPVIHGLTWAVNAWRYGTEKVPETEPLSLIYVYGTWLLVIALLTPICVLWGRLKRTRRWWWLSYL
ncbi:MAG: hypothetical protein GY913_03825 [Proteobacteria bacterium]|nr:hypothetical protein [Pseudomonadota bacterium]MCP4916031.1 hypothetical protein [Pseudomonadota bacterium]